jgi:glucose-1-phosphate cytidylyltransferase
MLYFFILEHWMNAVVLAGEIVTHLSEETSTHPKPMVEIGGKPILWHIMKMHSIQGCFVA